MMCNACFDEQDYIMASKDGAAIYRYNTGTTRRHGGDGAVLVFSLLLTTALLACGVPGANTRRSY
jgi:hypothetical protein